MPLISIILPTYNRKSLTRKAIESVLRQKWQEFFQWELIIIDDGSTDGTREHIQDIVDSHENMTYTYQENKWVGSARNRWIELMSKESEYLILLDSDDEIMDDCISFFLEKAKSEDPSVMGWYYLCEDESGKVIGDRKIILGKEKRDFSYEEFLWGEINVEMGIMVRSSLFLTDPKLRFPEDIITETVMWSKMWQYFEKHGYVIRLYGYVWRLYRTEHSEETRITKNITSERFRKNALGNERVLETIWPDLLQRGYQKSYADLLFRAWVNWILTNEATKGRKRIRKSFEYSKNIVHIGVYLLSFLGKGTLLFLYKRYI